MVDKYEKGEVRELETEFSPFGPEFSSTMVMKVRPGSKLHSLASFAEKQLENDACRSLIFAGIGPACTKTISAVEVLKRRIKLDLHQITRIRFKRVEEYWEPKTDSLERLKVNRDIPAIYILLSKDAPPRDDPGHQGPGREIPLLQAAMTGHRRQHQQQSRNAGADAPDNANRWKRRPRGSGRDKKGQPNRQADK